MMDQRLLQNGSLVASNVLLQNPSLNLPWTPTLAVGQVTEDQNLLLQQYNSMQSSIAPQAAPRDLSLQETTDQRLLQNGSLIASNVLLQNPSLNLPWTPNLEVGQAEEDQKL